MCFAAFGSQGRSDESLLPRGARRSLLRPSQFVLWRWSPSVLPHPPLFLPRPPRCQQAVQTLVLGPPPLPFRSLQVSCPLPSGMFAPVVYASVVATVRRPVAPTEGPLQQGQPSHISTVVWWSSMVDLFCVQGRQAVNHMK